MARCTVITAQGRSGLHQRRHLKGYLTCHKVVEITAPKSASYSWFERILSDSKILYILRVLIAYIEKVKSKCSRVFASIPAQNTDYFRILSFLF